MGQKEYVFFPKHRDTISCHDVPDNFKNFGVLTGYRPSGKPWSYYIKSIFQLHNETFNIWTHIIGMVVMSHLTVTHSITDQFDEPGVTSSIWLHGVCCNMMLIGSTLTHIFCSKSLVVNECIYFFDYAGISASNFGTHVLMFHHCYDRRWINFIGPYAMIFSVVVSASVNVLMCYGRALVKPHHPSSYKLFNLLPNAISLTFGVIPLVARLNFPDAAATELPDQDLERLVGNRLHLSNLLFIITGFFYASHIPERFFPGHFDIFGHSHMLVHIFITATHAVQQKGAYYDVHLAYITQEMRETISQYGSMWFYFFLLTALNLAVVMHCIQIVIGRKKKLAKSS